MEDMQAEKRDHAKESKGNGDMPQREMEICKAS